MGSTIMTRNADLSVVDLTLVTNTSQYADNDVLAVAQAVQGVYRGTNDIRRLRSIALLDEADQGVAIDLLFFNGAVTLGTINDVVAISDADARKALGCISIATSDYTDLVASQLATQSGLDLLLKADGDTNLYIGAVVRSGTPTYGTSSIKIKLGLE